jgi:hypothetical protein
MFIKYFQSYCIWFKAELIKSFFFILIVIVYRLFQYIFVTLFLCVTVCFSTYLLLCFYVFIVSPF